MDNNAANDGAGVGLLEAFINEVQAQAGQEIAPCEADPLIAEANKIIEFVTGFPAQAYPPLCDQQWATSATASSEYSNFSWSAAQAVGEPDTFACGDIATAWAPSTQGRDPEWLEVGFDRPVYGEELSIYETYNSGFVYQVDLIDLEGVFHTVWSGVDGTDCPGELVVSFPPTDYQVHGARIYTQSPGWEEIDAVKLIGN